MVWWNSSG